MIDATPAQLGKSLAKLRGRGIRLNINLLGEAVLGDEEAAHRLAGTRELLERDDVDYVSIKVSNVASQLSMWAFDDMVATVVERLTPLYEYAAASPTTKFINLDMEEYRDLDLTMAVFTRLLEQPSAQEPRGRHRAADLPARRARRAAAPHRVGDRTPRRRVALASRCASSRARTSRWSTWMPRCTTGRSPPTTRRSRPTRTTSACSTGRSCPSRTDAVRIGVAGHNLFDLAFAWLLAKRRRVEARVDFEMLLGMATGQAEAVKRDVGGLLLYTPVVQPSEFDSAISYLIRRLEENASTDNFMSGVFELATSDRIFERESDRFLASLAALNSADAAPHPNRVQDRGVTAARAIHAFANEPDTDPSIHVNRVWGARMLERSRDSRLGIGTIELARVTEAAQLEQLIQHAAAAGAEWGARPAAERARVLHDAGDVLAAFRGRLIEVMASETGKTIAEGDVEVSEAVDFAYYYAESALQLDGVDGATFVPPKLTVVMPPWNFPVAIPAGSVLAALAAGSAVIIKPAPQAKRSGAVMVEALWEAGVPRELLVLVDIEEARRAAIWAGSSSRIRRSTASSSPARGRRRRCSARGATICRSSPRRAARTRSSSRRAPTSTSRWPTWCAARSGMRGRSAPRHPS